jgi:hypothetical protein
LVVSDLARGYWSRVQHLKHLLKSIGKNFQNGTQIHSMTFSERLGVLRGLLLFFALLCCPFAWLAHTEPVGWGIITAYIIPSLVVLLSFLLLLDALMNRIFMLESSIETRAIQKFRLYSSLGVFILLMMCWIPYFRAIGTE